ncbi:MAG: ATPase, T2SS/T4P/T4SS family, partial [Halobacteriaceae archaeon]
FDLLEAALRQRPDYIVMGEVRGEEGRTLFQVMSTGHTTYTTFHADNVSEVLKRFTTDPINVSKTLFTALDLVSVQTQTRVRGTKVRRNKTLTEINHYDPENDEINVRDVYEWRPETDEFDQLGASNTLEEIAFDRGWSHETLQEERFKREVVLAYLIQNDLNTYAEVAATLQAFINDQETILTLIANDELEASLAALQDMESVLIDVDSEKEEMVPRPDPDDEMREHTASIIEEAERRLFDQYRGEDAEEIAEVLQADPATDVVADPGTGDEGMVPAANGGAGEAAADPAPGEQTTEQDQTGEQTQTEDSVEADEASAPDDGDLTDSGDSQDEDDVIAWSGDAEHSEDPDAGPAAEPATGDPGSEDTTDGPGSEDTTDEDAGDAFDTFESIAFDDGDDQEAETDGSGADDANAGTATDGDTQTEDEE